MADPQSRADSGHKGGSAVPFVAVAPGPGWLNSGDTGWQLTAATLVGLG